MGLEGGVDKLPHRVERPDGHADILRLRSSLAAPRARPAALHGRVRVQRRGTHRDANRVSKQRAPVHPSAVLHHANQRSARRGGAAGRPLAVDPLRERPHARGAAPYAARGAACRRRNAGLLQGQVRARDGRGRHDRVRTRAAGRGAWRVARGDGGARRERPLRGRKARQIRCLRAGDGGHRRRWADARHLRAASSGGSPARRRIQACADGGDEPARGSAQQYARHAPARRGGARIGRRQVRDDLHGQGGEPDKRHGHLEAPGGNPPAGPERRRHRLLRRAFRQRPRLERQRSAAVGGADRERRAGHRNRPADEALLHDRVRGRGACPVHGRAARRRRMRLHARHGQAGADARPRRGDDPPGRLRAGARHPDQVHRNSSRREALRGAGRHRQGVSAHGPREDLRGDVRRHFGGRCGGGCGACPGRQL